MNATQVAALRRAVIAEAEKDLGFVETPPHSNRGSVADRANAFVGNPLGSPWCAAWLCEVLHNAGVPPPLPKTGSSGGIAAWGKKNGRLDWSPEYGDAGELIDPSSPTGYRHTVLITGGDGVWLSTIEANMSDGVRRNRRHASTLTLVSPYPTPTNEAT